MQRCQQPLLFDVHGRRQWLRRKLLEDALAGVLLGRQHVERRTPRVLPRFVVKPSQYPQAARLAPRSVIFGMMKFTIILVNCFVATISQ